MTADVRTTARTTPAWTANTFTFVNSLGTYVVTSSGLYFLTKNGYGFTDQGNSLLGVVLGITYIFGALGAARVRPALAGALGGFTPRAMLGSLMVLMGGACLLPVVAKFIGGDADPPSTWPIWTLVLLYSSLSGMLWPVVESYISGGKSAGDLRRAMGFWNVVWSAAGVVSTIVVAPMVETAPALAIALVSLMHAGALVLLPRFAPEPAPHLDGAHEPHPPVYAHLLFTFRLLLPMSYVVMAALGPYLPRAAERVEIPGAWQAFIPIAWLLPRVLTFEVMRRWERWHGRWYLPIAGGCLLVGSFALTLGSAWFAPGIDAAVLLAGLLGFGVALGVIYTAAIYYAMEVGQAEVNAGGTHEALIGVGYTIGPAFGLAALLAEEHGLLRVGQGEALVMGAVFVLALATAGVVARHVARVSGRSER
ncbi:MAG: hypothetical protein SFY69_11385 [Planctomycetota bacterium]|nr:hypothetical protein [Planctomycetota bacterium]